MVFCEEDKALIKNMHLIKGYGAIRLIKEFPRKNWKLGGVNTLLTKIRKTGCTDRQKGSGRPRSIRNVVNVNAVQDMVLSQEDQPQTHRSTRQISRETGIHHSSVFRIIHQDLGLRCYKKRRAQELTAANRLIRLNRCKELLKQFSPGEVDFIWFTDEKVFTVATPNNTQNDRLYAAAGTRKKEIAAERLLRTRTTFSRSVMVSVGVSKLGCTNLIFVDPGVKVDGAYYRSVLLSKQLLPIMRQVSGDYFIFQQDSAPAHRARETVELLKRETPAFISPGLWPPNSPDLNPVDYKIWSVMQQRVYQTKVQDLDELKQRLIDVWNSMPQSIIDDAINEWRKCLRACARMRGGHFQHAL